MRLFGTVAVTAWVSIVTLVVMSNIPIELTELRVPYASAFFGLMAVTASKVTYEWLDTGPSYDVIVAKGMKVLVGGWVAIAISSL